MKCNIGVFGDPITDINQFIIKLNNNERDIKFKHNNNNCDVILLLLDSSKYKDIQKVPREYYYELNTDEIYKPIILLYTENNIFEISENNLIWKNTYTGFEFETLDLKLFYDTCVEYTNIGALTTKTFLEFLYKYDYYLNICTIEGIHIYYDEPDTYYRAILKLYPSFNFLKDKIECRTYRNLDIRKKIKNIEQYKFIVNDTILFKIMIFDNMIHIIK